jgi:hypothetical protein
MMTTNPQALSRSRGRRRTALAAVALTASLGFGLSGCSERVVAGDPTSAYTSAEVGYAANDRDFRVTIHGLPFGGDPVSFANAVLPSMQNRIMGVNTTLTTTPNDTARLDYRVALIFNATGNLPSWSACQDGPVPTLPPGVLPPDGTLVVQGAFCRGGGALTTATGWLDQPKGPEDPNFRQLISDMTVSLFPTQRADQDCTGGPEC